MINMTTRIKTGTTFEPENVIQPVYTGGDVSLDSEGQILAACLGEDALLTDLRTGQVLARIEGDGEVLTSLRITPSASHLIACSRSLSMRIYLLQRQHDDTNRIHPILQRTIKPHTSPVTVATIDETGSLLATGGADSTIKLWDIRGGYITHTFRGHTGVISALHFFTAPDSQIVSSGKGNQQWSPKRDPPEMDEENRKTAFRLASGGEDGKVRIWDLTRRKSIASLDSHVSVVRGLDYSREKKILVSASRDKTLILWNAQSWKYERVIPVLEVIEGVNFVANGAVLGTGGENGRLRLWSTMSGLELTPVQSAGSEGDAIVQLLYNAHQQVLMSVHNDQALLLHTTAALDKLATLTTNVEPLPVTRRISGTHDEIIDLAYVTQDRSLLALATNSEAIRLVSLAVSSSETSDSVSTAYFGADVALLQGHEEIVICLTVDWSGCWLATGAKDNTSRLWRIDQASHTYEPYAIFTGHAESIGAICLPSNSPQPESQAFKSPLDHPPSFLLTGSEDRTIKRWIIPKSSSTAPRALYTRKAHDKDINALAVSPTCHLFASASQDRTVKIWSTEEGETQGILRGHKRGVWSVAFAPKDTPIISSNDGSTGTNRGMVLTGSGDKTLKIWSLNDYSCLRTFEGHSNNVLKVLWLPAPLLPPPSSSSTHQTSPHRTPQVASAGADGLVKVWDPASTECLATLDNHTDRVWALATNTTDRTIVSGGADSVITFWKDTTEQTALLRDKATTQRVEQDQELSNYEHSGQYREAIALALALDHPARLLSLFQNVIDSDIPEEGSITGRKAVDDVLAQLEDGQLLKLLERVRDWNTNARTCSVAQRMLNVVVRNYSAERLSGLAKRRGGKEVVEALKVYTERHYRRIEELWGESWIVEFLLGEMGELMTGEDGEKKEINGVEHADTIMAL